MLKRVLLVSTSAHDMNGHPTGLWLEELAAPYNLFKKAKFDVDLVSIEGGRVPIDRVSIPNGIPHEFKQVATILQNTQPISKAYFSDYDAVLFGGGHGAIVDFPGNPYVANLIVNMYNNNRIVAAVCHGVSSLVGVKNKDGSFFSAGKRITGYTNDEEKAVHLEKRVPFLLESKLKEEGAFFYVAPNFTPHVVVDGRLITGQNPQSSLKIGKAIKNVINKM
ncbi:thiamine biosynthesis protein ThiJ [Bacillus proteolyticus]|uniref:Thiamine biosynthesis protein ThiJ n=1 Tax=Bacillus proteolyticus TaxID=2026192 RepID=A0AA44R7I8_9BACI|nr:type 1 glutamine amidotransferase domain-containing protein [Bacillus proteolyticus]OJE45130.1 thiamine biosynthesis protein ThiJ [Bacillus proteolyticus]PGV64627.1 type 1 glutamine amidotransferase domain-containing protein [Bacillus cereus]